MEELNKEVILDLLTLNKKSKMKLEMANRYIILKVAFNYLFTIFNHTFRTCSENQSVGFLAFLYSVFSYMVVCKA